MATSSKKLTKCIVREIASSISEELPPSFPKEVLEGVSTAVHITTFADHVTFVTTLHRHKGEFNSLLQHMSEAPYVYQDMSKRSNIPSCASTFDHIFDDFPFRQGLNRAKFALKWSCRTVLYLCIISATVPWMENCRWQNCTKFCGVGMDEEAESESEAIERCTITQSNFPCLCGW